MNTGEVLQVEDHSRRHPFLRLGAALTLVGASIGIGGHNSEADGISKVRAGTAVCVDVAYPVSIMVGNLTITEPDAAGFATPHATGGTWNKTSAVNYKANETVADAVITEIGADGKFCETSSAPNYPIIDVTGFIKKTAKAADSPAEPFRLVDTRDVSGPTGGAKLKAGQLLCKTVGMPGEVVEVTNTVVDTAGPGFANIYKSGSNPMGNSTNNYGSRDTVANTATVEVGADGQICEYVSQDSHVLIDVNLIFKADAITPASPNGKQRIVELRTTDSETGGRKLVAGSKVCRYIGHAGSTAIVTGTVASANGPGFANIYPNGGVWNANSVVNFTSEKDSANQAFIPVPADGTICMSASQDSYPLIDLVGFLAPEYTYPSSAAYRAFDGRSQEIVNSPVYEPFTVISSPNAFVGFDPATQLKITCDVQGKKDFMGNSIISRTINSNISGLVPYSGTPQSSSYVSLNYKGTGDQTPSGVSNYADASGKALLPETSEFPFGTSPDTYSHVNGTIQINIVDPPFGASNHKDLTVAVDFNC